MSILRSMAMLLGVIIISFVMVRHAYRNYSRRKNRPHLSPQQKLRQSAEQGREICYEIGELMAELNDLSRQINGQLDTRLTRLDILLQQADERIAQLKSLSPSDDSTAAVSPGDKPTPPAPVTVELIDEDAADPTEPPPAGTAPESPPSKLETPQAREIVERSNRGQSIQDISREMGRPTGEIELILALSKRVGPNP